ncbi:hypothetical protein KAR48_03080 [bacterium]|nr:hypothetical protein [bacterium]
MVHLRCKIIIMLLFAFGISYGQTVIWQHEKPVLIREGDELTMEVLCVGGEVTAWQSTLFYRFNGTDVYQRVQMEQQGQSFSTTIEIQREGAEYFEYYFGFENSFGGIETLPAEQAAMNPYKIAVTPFNVQSGTDFEVIILGPLPESRMDKADIVIAASVPDPGVVINWANSRLLLDGTDVTAAAAISDNILVYLPDNMKKGRHVVQWHLIDDAGAQLKTVTWNFYVLDDEHTDREYRLSGSTFFDMRNQSMAGRDDSFYRGGFLGRLISGGWDLRTRLYLSSDESANRQAINRYTLDLQYNISDRNYLQMVMGDGLPDWGPLAFQDKRLRGVQGSVRYGALALDGMTGQTRRAVEGSVETDGSFSQRIWGVRAGTRMGKQSIWHFDVLKSAEDPESVKYGANAKEALVAGTGIELNLHRRRIHFNADVKASIKNVDAGAPEMTWDDLMEFDSSFADQSSLKSAYEWLQSSGLISTTTGLSPYPSLAVKAELGLRYFRNNLRIIYRNIEKEFVSPGNPFLLKDIRGLFIQDQFRLPGNRAILNVSFKHYENHVTDSDAPVKHTEFGTSLSIYPGKRFPTVTLGMENYDRKISDSGDVDLMPFLYNGDQQIRRYSMTAGYPFVIQSVQNTVSLHLSSYSSIYNADTESSENQNITLSMRSRFSFPLTLRGSWGRTETIIPDNAQLELTQSRFTIRTDYKWKKPSGLQLNPYLSFSQNKIDHGEISNGIIASDRSYLSAGFLIRLPRRGRLSFRFDSIQYERQGESVNDHIMNLRYEIQFK